MANAYVIIEGTVRGWAKRLDDTKARWLSRFDIFKSKDASSIPLDVFKKLITQLDRHELLKLKTEMDEIGSETKASLREARVKAYTEKIFADPILYKEAEKLSVSIMRHSQAIQQELNRRNTNAPFANMFMRAAHEILDEKTIEKIMEHARNEERNSRGRT